MNAAADPPPRPLTFTLGMTGERFDYLSSARSGDGVFRFRWTLAPGRRGPPQHYHPDETETFEVESGTLQVWVDGAHHVLGPGARLAVPPRAPHRFFNAGPEPAVVRVSLDGTRMEDSHVPMAVYHARHGRFGLRGGLRVIVHDAEVGAALATFAPINWLQRGLARVLRLFGVRRFPSVAW